MSNNNLEREKSSAITRNLTREAWTALRDAAAALLNVASAALGEVSCPDPKILPLSTGTPPHLVSTPTPALRAIDSDSTTVIECVRDFLHAKARAGRSDRYLAALKVSLTSFTEGRARMPLTAVTYTEIESWLDAHNWAARTKRGYLCDVRTMFNFAIRRSLVSHNPASAVELPVVASDAAAIHEPRQVTTILNFARQYDLNICRSLAVRYFCGLRSSEVGRLEENEVRENFIEVTAAKSKTRRRRLVTIQPNLRLWLDLGGVLPLRDVNNRMRLFVAALAKQHAIEWAHNVTRHSFCSYHLAHFGNAGKTALEAGHSEQMLFTHYRELVTPETARAFWNIVPEGEPGKETGKILHRRRKRNWRMAEEMV